VTAGLYLAFSVGVPLATWIGAYVGWRTAYWLLAVATITTLCGIALFLRGLPEQPKVGLQDRLGVLADRCVLHALTLTVLWTAGNFTVYTYIAPIFAALAEARPEQITWVVLTYGVAGLLGTVLGGRLADRYGVMVPITGGLVAIVVAFALIAGAATVGPSPKLFWIGIAAVALWGTASSALLPSQHSRLVALSTPGTSSIVLSLNTSCIYLGMAVGALLGGVIVAMSTPSLGLAAAALGLLNLAILHGCKPAKPMRR
jgi:predicted MFS family arabinose efflux permease